MNHSRIADLLACPRRYALAYEVGLAAEEDKPALKFGSLWHKIMELWHKGTWASPDACVDQALVDTNWQDSPEDWRTGAKARAAFHNWLALYAEAPEWRVLATEQKVEAQIVPGVEPHDGTIDALVVTADPETGKTGLWVVDYKTTSRLETDWVSYYRVSNQFKWYLLNIRQNPEYADAEGVIVDLYHCTKGVVKTTDPTKASGNAFYRQYFRFSEYVLNEAEADYQVAIATRNLYRGLGYFPKNTRACHQFNSKCPFLEHCDAQDPETRAKLFPHPKEDA